MLCLSHVAACGQKGNLYLPGEKAKPVATTTPAEDTDRDPQNTSRRN
jgi:predicted small lipoprotein YifL